VSRNATKTEMLVQVPEYNQSSEKEQYERQESLGVEVRVQGKQTKAKGPKLSRKKTANQKQKRQI
jgi:hypothetical protein